MSERPLHKNNFPQAFFPIVGLYSMDCHYHLNTLYNSYGRLFICGRYKGQQNELMLRYRDSELVVARVEFIHKHQGYMTELYRILKDIKRSYRLKKIVIECVQTEEMKNWCLKNGFKENPFYLKCYEHK